MGEIDGIRSLEKLQRIEAVFEKHFGAVGVDDAPDLFVGVPELPRYGLVGRDPLLAELISRLGGGDPVALSTSGQGGAGKTALAISAAHHPQLLKAFPGGVLWASVGPKGDPLLALGRWAEALSLDLRDYPQPPQLKEAVRKRIGQRRLLLVLDDIWHIEHAELLRCGGRRCAYLLTTRSNRIARRFAGRRNNALDIPELEEDTAFTLLQEIAPEACAVDETASRALVRQVGGLPLAVELLGGYLTEAGAPDPILFPDLSQELLEDLQDPAVRLRQAGRRLGDLSGAAESLADVMALSLEDFGEEEQAAFYALGAFAPKPATFSRPAAEAVSGADGKLLSRFVNRSLLEIEGSAFTLHQVLADLARSRMDETAQDRHAAYYLKLANEDRTDWQRIDAAYDQIRWAWANVPEEACLVWVWALRYHQRLRGLTADSIAWFERGLAWVRDNDERENEATLLNELGLVYANTGRPEEALRLYDEALDIRSEEGDRAGEAETLNNMGEVYRTTGRPEEALGWYREALPISREVGDRAMEATTLDNMAGMYEARGWPKKALRKYEEALTIRREVGDRAGEAATLNHMGKVQHDRGRLEAALRLYEESLSTCREVGDRAQEATTLWNLALLLEDLGRIPEAIERLQEAIPLFHDGLTHDAGGGTVDEYERELRRLQS